MKPVRAEAGEPRRGGQPVVVAALRYEPQGSLATVRTEVRWLAETGWLGIWLADATGELADLAAETARRAGLAVIVEPGLWEPAEHLLALPEAEVAVDEPVAAFERCFAGARVIVGDESAVDGLRQYLALADAPAAWLPLPAPDGWVARGCETEAGWFTATGADLQIDLPDGCRGAVHLVDPELGIILGLVTPRPNEPVEFRGEGDPIAIYCGPNRYEPDDYVTRPD